MNTEITNNLVGRNVRGRVWAMSWHFTEWGGGFSIYQESSQVHRKTPWTLMELQRFFFFPASFKIFLSLRFSEGWLWYSQVYILWYSSAWYSLRFMDLWFDVHHQYWEILSHHSFNYSILDSRSSPFGNLIMCILQFLLVFHSSWIFCSVVFIIFFNFVFQLWKSLWTFLQVHWLFP